MEGFQGVVGGMTVATAKNYALTTLRPRDFPEFDWGSLLEHFTAPESFDSRTQWPGCVHAVLDQGQCGSCWAFGATEALSDRFCIASGGSINVVLSAQYLVNCDFTSFGCNGGYPDLAWRFMQLKGVPTSACVSYTAKDGACPKSCDDGSALRLYKAASVSSFTSPASIQAAILSLGPVEASFTVYQDFMAYTSGVYQHTWGEQLGGHAIKMVGWGVEQGLNYWICQNSWGTGWGIQGYFWIAFGQCGIDSACVGGTPAV
jgi:cathepsin B